MIERTDCVVIGAGVVGLAVGRALARAGREVLVVERHAHPGTEQSSRNSEVLHAGIYYPAGSLKGRLCVPGRKALQRYCDERGIAWDSIGKLVVATQPADMSELRKLRARGQAHGVEGLEVLSADAARELEPALEAVGALWSPRTGRIDVHGLVLALAGDLEAAGGLLVCNNSVETLTGNDGGICLRLADGQQLLARTCVNAAGIDAVPLLKRSGIAAPAVQLVKGNYFHCAAPVPFQHLIYPVPDALGLGIHLTIDLGGRVRFGPDTQPVTTVDYRVDPARRKRFVEAIQRYYPELDPVTLLPDHAGVRTRAVDGDFHIETVNEHGVPGLVNLLGIDSPGLTAGLAIADEVVARVG